MYVTCIVTLYTVESVLEACSEPRGIVANSWKGSGMIFYLPSDDALEAALKVAQEVSEAASSWELLAGVVEHCSASLA